jgi:hypothetical protein
MRRSIHAISLLPALLAAPLAAQDMIAVTFQGQVLRLGSQTSSVTTLASGQSGKTCLAIAPDNRLWTNVRSGTAAAGFHYHLALLDPVTGAESLPFGNADVGNLIALASPSSASDLFGIRDAGGPDELIRIDTSTGVLTVVGPTGLSDMVGLDFTTAGARAWSASAGLLLISLATGAVNDLFPSLGGPAGMTFMATNPATGTTFVGGPSLHVVAVFSGGVGAATATFPGLDVRAAQFTTSRLQAFGSACQATTGSAGLGGVQPFGAGQPFTAKSIRHSAGAFGVQIVGFSETSFQGQPLPVSVDPIFGTSGCFLRVSADFTLGGVANTNGDMFVTMNLPPTIAFRQFYVQHAVLEPVPGGISFSNGLRVRPGL